MSSYVQPNQTSSLLFTTCDMKATSVAPNSHSSPSEWVIFWIINHHSCYMASRLCGGGKCKGSLSCQPFEYRVAIDALFLCAVINLFNPFFSCCLISVMGQAFRLGCNWKDEIKRWNAFNSFFVSELWLRIKARVSFFRLFYILKYVGKY